MFEEINNFVKSFMKHSGHPYSHVKRVFLLCNKAAEEDNTINSEVLLPAALLHDIARANEFGEAPESEARRIVCYDSSELKKNHSEIGAKWAGNYLSSINYPEDLSSQIVYCIRNHSYNGKKFPETIEARLIQEADRVDAIGAIGIIRTTVHNFDKQAYHLSDPLARKREPDDWTYGLDHFQIKLLKLKGTISTPIFSEIAQKKHGFMLYFLGRLEHEVLNNNHEGPAVTILKTLRANYNLPYYDEEEPFSAEKNTIIAELVKLSSNFFVKEFIEELKTEIL